MDAAPLPPRGESLRGIHDRLAAAVAELGVGHVSRVLGVSDDTVRRRVRAAQPWLFSEVFDLARHQLTRQDASEGEIAAAIGAALTPADRRQARPLLLPSSLRGMLKLIGRITADIAETLEDGRVDATEARELLAVLGQLERSTSAIRLDLQAVTGS